MQGPTASSSPQGTVLSILCLAENATHAPSSHPLTMTPWCCPLHALVILARSCAQIAVRDSCWGMQTSCTVHHLASAGVLFGLHDQARTVVYLAAQVVRCRMLNSAC